MEAGRFSLWHWAIVIFVVLLPLGYGIAVLVRRKGSAFSKSRAGFFKGFGIGFALLAAVNVLQMFNSKQVPSGPGPWIDLARRVKKRNRPTRHHAASR
jgi:hypothetical protein